MVLHLRPSIPIDVTRDIHRANSHLYKAEYNSIMKSREVSKWLFDKYPDEMFVLLWNDEHSYYKIYLLSQLS